VEEVMAKEDTYAQCELRRVDGKFDVVWIPEKFAQKGRSIRIKDDNGSWEDGWKVMEVYTRKAFSEIELKERDHLRQREASDV
jgi:hypothetical protein